MEMSTAPMICSTRSGDLPGEDSWMRQDYQDGICNRSRADRKARVKVRRAGRRIEKAALRIELADLED